MSYKISEELSKLMNQCQKKFPPLSAEEEKKYRELLVRGNSQEKINARNRLVYGSLTYIVKCVIKNPKIKPDDIYNTVMDVTAEMLNNAFRYNPDFNFKFITYMDRLIKQTILRHAYPLSADDTKFYNRYLELKSEYAASGYDPSDEDLFRHFDMAKFSTFRQKISSIDNIIRQKSLDTPIAYGNPDSDNLASQLESRFQTPEDEYLATEIKTNLEEAIQNLPEVERKYLLLNIGYDNQPMSARQIAIQEGSNRTTVSNKINKAKEEIRKYFQDKNMAA